jgi:hypothetical protein
MSIKYSDREMIKWLRMKAKELGRTPVQEEIRKDKRLPSSLTFHKHFGSYRNALKIAGLKPKPIGYDCQEILKLIKKKAQELGRVPKMKEVNSDPNMPSTEVYRRCFGTFTAAVRKAGYTPFREYSNIEILKLFKEKALKLGRSPTAVEINEDKDLPCSALYHKRFGNLRNIQRRLGIKPNILKYTDEELIAMLKNKSRQLKRPPIAKDIAKDRDLPCLSVYYTRFGSLQRARELAGCPSPHVHRTYTERELLKMLQKKIKELGRMPLTKEINLDTSMPHSVTYRYRFDGWQNLLRKMGFPIQKKHKAKGSYLTKTGYYNIPKIVSRLRQHVKRLKRLPSSSELDRDPFIPYHQTIRKIFGGMDNLAKLLNVPWFGNRVSYSDEELLECLKMKANELGRAPREEEMNKDARFAGACTYHARFGSFIKALDRIGMAPRFRFITKAELKNQIIKFSKEYRKVPTQKEFECSPDFPPLSIFRKRALTWNQLLDECRLPIHSNGITRYVNRSAEIVVKNLLISAGLGVEDMTVKSAHSKYSFKVDKRIRVHVSGATWQERGWKHSYLIWGFGVPDKKEFDYMVGIGFNKRMKVEAIYVFPVDMLIATCITTAAFRESKYSEFRLDSFEELAKIIGVLKRRKRNLRR